LCLAKRGFDAVKPLLKGFGVSFPQSQDAAAPIVQDSGDVVASDDYASGGCSDKTIFGNFLLYHGL
jgi:hypothetical protein